MHKANDFYEQTERLMAGINAAYKEMLIEKALHGRKVVLADNNGQVIIEDAQAVYDRLYK